MVPPDTGFPAQVMITVGKKAFRHAVDRNRIRRQFREAYRLHKHELYHFLDDHQQRCIVGFLYTAGQKLKQDELDRKIKAALHRLFFEIQKKLNKPALPLSQQENTQS